MYPTVLYIRSYLVLTKAEVTLAMVEINTRRCARGEPRLPYINFGESMVITREDFQPCSGIIAGSCSDMIRNLLADNHSIAASAAAVAQVTLALWQGESYDDRVVQWIPVIRQMAQGTSFGPLEDRAYTHTHAVITHIHTVRSLDVTPTVNRN